MARGVGTAKILGRVHSAQMKVGGIHLPCSLTIMEGRDVDMLLGLDMLKAHQACIDLERNCLRIQGQEIRFLSDHELPAKARGEGREEFLQEPDPANNPSRQASTSSQPQFPGGGNTIGRPPMSSPNTRSQPSAAEFPEQAIATLVGLGATREQALAALRSAGGNVDLAASFLFNF